MLSIGFESRVEPAGTASCSDLENILGLRSEFARRFLGESTGSQAGKLRPDILSGQNVTWRQRTAGRTFSIELIAFYRYLLPQAGRGGTGHVYIRRFRQLELRLHAHSLFLEFMVPSAKLELGFRIPQLRDS